MNPLIHLACGQQMGWRIGSSKRITSDNFMRMDGTHPKAFDRMDEKCPNCAGRINNMSAQVFTKQ